MLCYVLWLSSLVWIILKVEDRFFRSFIVACTLDICHWGVDIYFLPNLRKSRHIRRERYLCRLSCALFTKTGEDMMPFPAGTSTSPPCWLYSLVAGIRAQKLLWIVILVIVSLSTLFTGQHYILDVVGGYVVALAGYHFGLWWAGFYPAQKRTR